ncbi:MAG: restriction endonuclease [Comamonadaceae bacterium]|nr:restriction endonuclease [Comamonadaceae bacterium]
MARRRKSSTAEDLMDLVAMLPWWLGVALALVSYWLLHGLAERPLPAATSTQQMGQFVLSAGLRTFATFGQYILPALCLLGAFVSALRKHRRRTLLETTAASSSADALQGMTWQQFEILVGEGFRRRGYSVKEIGGGGADGGVDLVLNKAGEKYLVQCKQWKAFKVGVPIVREMYGLMAAYGAAGGFVVTSGSFTKEASAFANGRNIQLMDGSALMKLLREASAKVSIHETVAPAVPSPSVRTQAHLSESAVSPPVPGAPLKPQGSAEPFCPVCAKPMVRKVAKRGPTPGKAFWGCPDFTSGCRGTREIQEA